MRNIYQSFDVRTNTSIYHKVEGKAAGDDQDGLEPDGAGRMHDTTIMEVTPMENHDKNMVGDIPPKDADCRPHLSCCAAFVDSIPVSEFLAIASLVSSENDIDILNTA